MPAPSSRKPAARPAKTAHVTAQPSKASFPIIGIGASAGGLEALEQFFGGMTETGPAAYVVVQHLDPNRKGLLPELLQRITPMPVHQALDHMAVKPGEVYVIPPNRDLSILHDTLYLLEPATPRGLRLPIDFFLRALAEDRREQAIGVILSGMGSDGTLGLRAIKEQAGLTLVQEPASAKFDAMPRSAIDAGLADIIAPASELAARIARHVHHGAGSARHSAGAESPAQRSALDKVFILLRDQTGHDFWLYKKSTVYRRVERRMGIHQIARIADYVRFLRENPLEVSLLFKELLIGVTSFFRDPAAWAYLQENILPARLAAAPTSRPMRAWVVGCSTGEEAYSLAIAFKEVQERLQPPRRISLQIFATDLDPDAIDRARQGVYPANIAADVSVERLARFFVEDQGGFRVSKEIREMVVFATQNVIMDPPFTKLDILSCRNLLIYFGAELQKRLLPLFHYSLLPGGVLFLGSAESIGTFTELFAPLEAKARLFSREAGAPRALEIEFPSREMTYGDEGGEGPPATSPPANLQALADQLLLQRFAPAAVLVSGEGDVIYISGRTGKYLEPAAGKANWNIHVMAREGLRHELALAMPKALRTGETVTTRSLRVGGDGSGLRVDLTVHPITEPARLQGMLMIVFEELSLPASATDPAGPRKGSRHLRVTELERALREASEEVQTIREEMQSSQEELKSANEELQSTNEELQSTNEELTTSKEEMQSLNEELQTVNVELQTKLEELSATNSDMKNLLNSTDIATVFLDDALHVRRFTDRATRIFKLIPGDVGRPLSDIATVLDYPQMMGDATEVLRTLVYSEKQIATRDERWFLVRIMPYRSLENLIDGVVITFTDITLSKQLEARLRALQGEAGAD